MRFISWNVNGLRACMTKGFPEFFSEVSADAFCVQETKLQPEQIALDFPAYHQFWNSAEKKGYSGTAIFTKNEPLSVRYGLGIEEHDHEGRVITLEYADYYLVCVYTPNAQRDLARLPYRMTWEDAFADYVCALDREKPVIICGDMNVAPEEIDLKNAKSNIGNAGFTYEERGKFADLLERGFIDSYRALNPEKTGAYTWWSYMFHAREKNAGWRIDFFLISERLREKLKDAMIFPEIMGSDHCPVGVELEL